MTHLPRLRRADRDQRGSSAVEYALIMILIAVVIILGVSALGTSTSAMYDKPCAELAANGNPC